MRNFYSNILKDNNKNISKALRFLKNNKLIAIPTETVYGLCGNAYSNKATRKIFKIKKRPLSNPLIVHYFNSSEILNDVVVNKNFFKLYKVFCPGPITFVLKKKKKSLISNFALAKQNTVAIRFPSHKVTRKILKNLSFPLAMPSANISNNVSPVNSKHVFEEFGKKLKIIIDGSDCKIGIESTVVDLTNKIKILRPGVITSSQIRRVIKSKLATVNFSKISNSPGLFKRHYSPGIPMKLNQKKAQKNCAFIIFGNRYKKTNNTFNLSEKSNLDEAAKNLYKIFHKIKKLKYKKIYVVKIPNKGIGVAINDRLLKASN